MLEAKIIFLVNSSFLVHSKNQIAVELGLVSTVSSLFQLGHIPRKHTLLGFFLGSTVPGSGEIR